MLYNLQDILNTNQNKCIVAFLGRAGSGKDYQSQKLVEDYNFNKIAFATPLRKILFTTLGMTEQQGMSQYEELKRTVIFNGQTLRNMLENLGTQGIRAYDPHFWIKCLQQDILKYGYKKVCISDMRYLNEYFALEQFAQQHDYTFYAVFCNYISDRYQETNNHSSAWLANKLCELGKYDLQIIDKDCLMDLAKEQVV